MNDRESTDPAARAEIQAVFNDPGHPYWKSDHPQHAEEVARVTGLYQRAHPEPLEEGAAPGTEHAPPASAGIDLASARQEARVRDILHDADWLAGHHKDQEALTGEYARLMQTLHPDPPAEETSPVPRTPTEAAALDPETGLTLSPPPDARLAPIWRDRPDVREFIGETGRLGVPAADLIEMSRYVNDPQRPEPPDSDTALSLLEKEWGANLSRNVLAAKLGAYILAQGNWQKAKTYLEDSGLGDDPKTIRFLAKIGLPHLAAAHTLEANLTAGPEHPFRNSRHPQHADTVREHAELYRRLLGDR